VEHAADRFLGAMLGVCGDCMLHEQLAGCVCDRSPLKLVPPRSKPNTRPGSIIT
jgi:hypothetical protein